MSDQQLPPRELAFVPAFGIQPERVEWLMDAWMPRRSLTLLAGREGLGKSTIAVDIAARATRGELDNGQPLRVLYLATEDSRSMTVVPRLTAAGADLNRVGFLDVSLGEYSGALSLPHDFPALADLIVAEGIGLVILDAAKSAMSSKLNDHRDDDVRRFLEPMTKIADDHDVAFLALVHIGKRGGADSGLSILGSIAWSQVARSVLSVARDDDNGALVVTNTKGNLSDRELSLKARITSAAVPLNDGTETTAGRLEWLGESSRSYRDVMADHDQEDDRSEIESVVLDYLEAQGGSAPAGDVLNASRAAGLSDNAVKKARRRIGVKTTKAGMGAGWVWTIDAPKVPEDSKGAYTNARESSTPSREPSHHFDDSPPLYAVPDAHSARSAVLAMLSPEYALDARTVAGGLPKAQRGDVPALLDALVDDGAAMLDERGRYVLAAS